MINSIRTWLTKINDTAWYNFIVNLIKAIYLFFPGILFIFLYYFIIVGMPIGQDMLMQAGEYPGPMVWTYVSLFLWMLFSWFSSRLVADQVPKLKIHAPVIYTHFPRLLGYNVPVGLQLATVNLPTVFNLPEWGLWLFLLAHNLYYVLLILSFRAGKILLRWLVMAVALGYVTFLLIRYYNSSNAEELRHVKALWLMAVFFFVIQVVFVFWVYYKKALLGMQVLNKIPWMMFYRIVASVAVIIYLTLIFSPFFSDHYGAIGCTLIGFAVLVGFIYAVRYWAIRSRLKFGLLLLALAIIIGRKYDPYEVELMPDTNKRVYSNRPTLDTFLYKWMTDSVRYKKIVRGNYPVYLVIADGGASKSGYWVASVLSKFEQETPDTNKFSEHLLSPSGASGGSVGNAAFYALLKEKKKILPDSLQRESEKFFKGDFPTYTLARYLGPDIFRHFIPLNDFDDRAAALEHSMETLSRSALVSSYFSKPLQAVIDYNGTLPMLLVNTTILQSGMPAVISTVKVDTSYSDRQDVLNIIDVYGVTDSLHRNIKLSTAVVLGARFPYVSPAGNIGEDYFVDGGYFDNSGGGITLDILEHIRKKSLDTSDRKMRPLLQKLKFEVLYISNGSLSQHRASRLHPLLNDAAAPLITVTNTYGQQTDISNKRLMNFMKGWNCSLQNCYDTLNLPMLGVDKLDYPMNWVISDFNMDRIKKNLKEIKVKKVLSDLY